MRTSQWGVKWAGAAALAITIAISGCGQSLLDANSLDAKSGGVFDWLDSSEKKAAPLAEVQKKRGSRSHASDDLKYEEIYYGDGANREVRSPAMNAASPAGLVRVNDKGSVRGAKKSEDGISLNFENAEIKSVARTILGDMLNLNFTIDPSLSGAITLSTRRPLRREQLLGALETALRSRGAVMVQSNGFVRVVPDKEAVGLGRANVGKSAGNGGYGLTALPLENISAEAVAKILDGFGAQEGAVRVDPALNLLIVRGTSEEREQLLETAQAFDVDWMRNQVVAIFPVRNASPDTVIAELGKALGSVAITYQPIERMNAILAVSKSADAIQQASNWVARLDRVTDAAPRVRVFRLKHADARRVATLVRDMFGSGGGQAQLGVDGGLLAPKGEKVSARLSPTTKASLGTRLQSDAPPEVAGSPEPLEAGAGGAPKIRVGADVANNAVVVHSSLQEAKLIERAIRDLDRAPAQVAIEATVAEITLNNTLNNGVQFYLRGKWGAISQSQDNPPLGRVVPGLNLLLGNEASPRIVLDALRTVSNVKVLSSPSLVVVTNQTAVLQVGDQVPITTRTAQAVVDPLAPIVNSVDFRDTGVILRITPQVQANFMVGIEIEQEISSVKDTNGGAETLTPTISQRRVKSTVAVADGQTLVLAGLISEQKTRAKSGVPGIIDIPIVSNILASKNTDETVRTELIIFIKPQVIRNMADARRVAEGLRERMKGFDRW